MKKGNAIYIVAAFLLLGMGVGAFFLIKKLKEKYEGDAAKDIANIMAANLACVKSKPGPARRCGKDSPFAFTTMMSDQACQECMLPNAQAIDNICSQAGGQCGSLRECKEINGQCHYKLYKH